MKVTTKGFQILKDETTFEFEPGITILQGESANGKSSLFYAIEYCLLNTPGTDYCINWDCKQAEVTIENNGNSVTWVKTPTSSTYINNKTGQTFVKASKLDSRDIADLGFRFDHKDNILNLNGEWSTLFPFGLSTTEMFKQFEDIFNITSSYQILDLIKKDEQQINSEMNFAKQNINNLTQSKGKIENILGSVDINKLDNLIINLEQDQSFMEELQKDINTYNTMLHRTQLTIPNIYEDTKFYELNNVLKNLEEDLNIYKVNQKRSHINIPELKEFNIIEPEIVKEYSIYENKQNEIISLDKQLNELTEQENILKEKLKEIKVCPTCGRPF